MKKLLSVFFILSLAISAKATVVINDLTITDTNLSFSVAGTVSDLGTGFHHQILFGLVDNADDWINSFDEGASSWVEGASNAVSIDSVYDLTGSYTDSLLTVSGPDWQLGDVMDLAFDFVGSFNVANFDASLFGMQVGYTSGGIVSSDHNIVEAVNPTASVPEPSSLILLILGLAGVGFSRKRLA